MLTILSVLVMILMAFSAVFASSSVSASSKREWKQIFLYSFIGGVFIIIVTVIKMFLEFISTT